MADVEKFEAWALLELMGHRRLAGKVSDALIGGATVIRIDVPGENDTWTTQFYAPSALYCLTPVSESTARDLAKRMRPAPIHPFELRAAIPARVGAGHNDRDLFDDPDGDD